MEQPSELTENIRRSNGLFKFMKKGINIRKKKNERHIESVQPQRRIVKAVPPIADIPVSQCNSVDEDVRDDPDILSETHLPVTKLPLVQQQLDIDHAEKWRLQRLEVSAAVRKEIKEKEIHEHRFKNSDASCIKSPRKPDSDGHSSVSNVSGSNIPSILSVESQHPEHKRTVQEREMEDETPVKRGKYITESKLLIDAIKKDETRIMKETIRKYCIPAAVAIAAIYLMKFLRR
jgi:hypothetical protein